MTRKDDLGLMSMDQIHLRFPFVSFQSSPPLSNPLTLMMSSKWCTTSTMVRSGRHGDSHGHLSAHHFRVTQLEFPVSLAAVDFAAQAADVLSKLEPYQDATFATLERP